MRITPPISALLFLSMVLLYLLAPVGIAASEVPLRQVGIWILNQNLQMSFSYRDAFNKTVRKKLSSGLTTSVVVQVSLERQGSETPVSYWARTAEITYDLWEEKYIVVREDNAVRRKSTVNTQKEAIDLAGILSQVDVASIRGVPRGDYRLRVQVEANPVSKEMVDKIRHWLARSRAKQSGTSGPSNYFGSFVGALVDRRIGQADHSFEFVSQWFRLGGR